MQRVLVLGATGMLGSMVYRYFSTQTAHTVYATSRTKDPHTGHLAFDAEPDDENALAALLERARPDFIINGIGIIKPYCKDDDPPGIARAVRVNALFPYRLAAAARRARARVIQIATDCVFNGKEGQYIESDPHDPPDVYGKTKSLGEVKAEHVLNIRCSVIGPEPFHKISLMEWFLGQEDNATVQGFAHHLWNGVTTLQFAQCCADIVSAGEHFFNELARVSSVHHFIPNATVTKYDLLCTLADVFGKRVHIEKASASGPPVNRTLASRCFLLGTPHGSKPFREAIQELKECMEKSTITVPASSIPARS